MGRAQGVAEHWGDPALQSTIKPGTADEGRGADGRRLVPPFFTLLPPPAVFWVLVGFFKDFLRWPSFKVFTEFVTTLLLLYVFGFLTPERVGL